MSILRDEATFREEAVFLEVVDGPFYCNNATRGSGEVADLDVTALRQTGDMFRLLGRTYPRT